MLRWFRSLEEQTQWLVAAALVAGILTLFLLFLPGEHQVQMDTLVPWAPDCLSFGHAVPSPGCSDGMTDHREAMRLVLVLYAVAIAPLLVRGSSRGRVALAACVLLGAFAVVTILHLGLVYGFVAWCLGMAATRKAPSPESSPEALIEP